MSSRLLLLSGGFFDFEKPEDSIYTIEDVAIGLSRCFRFGGHTTYPITVAQHSVILSYIAPESEALDALCHDGFEAFGNDLVRSLKGLLDDYQWIENKAMLDMFGRLGLSWPLSETVTRLDKELGDMEKDFLNGGSSNPLPSAWMKSIAGYGGWWLGLESAKQCFLNRWQTLTGKAKNHILNRS